MPPTRRPPRRSGSVDARVERRERVHQRERERAALPAGRVDEAADRRAEDGGAAEAHQEEARDALRVDLHAVDDLRRVHVVEVRPRSQSAILYSQNTARKRHLSALTALTISGFSAGVSLSPDCCCERVPTTSAAQAPDSPRKSRLKSDSGARAASSPPRSVLTAGGSAAAAAAARRRRGRTRAAGPAAPRRGAGAATPRRTPRRRPGGGAAGAEWPSCR